MHELGVVFYIIDDIKEAAAQNQVTKVTSVTIELGEVSTVIPYYLDDCFNWAKKKHGPLLEDCVMHIEQIKAVTFCEDCKKEYPTVEYGKTCPHCGSGNTYSLRGNEFTIKQIEAR